MSDYCYNQYDSPEPSYLLSSEIMATEKSSFSTALDNYCTKRLLGEEELDDNIRERKMLIYIVSWNMFGMTTCPKQLRHLVCPESTGIISDLFVIGSQENEIEKRLWELQLQKALGISHVLIKSFVCGTLHLAIFTRKNLHWYYSDLAATKYLVQVWTPYRTKGSLAICMTFFGSRFLFINSHFVSGVDSCRERVSDYQKTLTQLRLPGHNQNDEPITRFYHNVFWFGDMNFRIEPSDNVRVSMLRRMTKIDIYDFSHAVKADQLSQLMKNGDIFDEFKEGNITFPPTYKFNQHTDVYSILRTPSYTDRILYHTKGSIDCLAYDSIQTLMCSDHRAVFAKFHVAIIPCRRRYNIGRLIYDRQLFIDAYKHMKYKPSSKTKTKVSNSVMCCIV